MNSPTSINPPINILHIASGDLWAGAEVQLFTLAKTLHNFSGASVRVVLLNQGILAEKLLREGIKVAVIDESDLNSLQILHQLIHTIKQRRTDIIHTHRVKENILGSLAGLLAGGIPSIRTTHGAPENYHPLRQLSHHIIRFFDWLTARILQKRIITVSEDLSHLLEKSFPPEKVRVIQNGIDLNITPKHSSRQTNKLKRNLGTMKIGLAGRLVPVKRVDVFIQTARYVLDHYPELTTSFHIYGDGPMRYDLESLSKELGTDEIIHFEGHCDNMPQRLQGLDVLLMTSDHEGLPMILLEAMALQTPIIAHAVGGIPTLLDDGTCGILVKEQNAYSYAHEIKQLHQSPQRLSNLSKNALQRVQSIYSAEHNAQAYLAIYSEILQGTI